MHLHNQSIYIQKYIKEIKEMSPTMFMGIYNWTYDEYLPGTLDPKKLASHNYISLKIIYHYLKLFYVG